MSEKIAPTRAVLSAPITYFPRPILESRRPALAIGFAWLLTFPLSIAFATLLAVFIPDAPKPQFPFSGVELFVRLVVVAPILETLIMGVALLIFLLFLPRTWAVLLTAVLAGLAHSFAPNGVAIWGLVIWWPFLIFSVLFVVWRERSLLAAFAMPTLAHALHNLPTAALIAGGLKL